MLGRMAGVEDTDYTTSVFRDVPDGEWYTSFVAWATENGIVDGYGDGIFLPQNNITRQEMAKIMAKYLNWKGLDTTPSSEISSYPINDLNAIGGWALEPVCFCYEQGPAQRPRFQILPRRTTPRAPRRVWCSAAFRSMWTHSPRSRPQQSRQRLPVDFLHFRGIIRLTYC